ncbi:substrate-binding domain-containing protein [Saccharicrinis sp. FJH54]|uniref:LacI family DNA-binding transcriptional regulator n=1 Tax=Saccharicrinis sp. FJH54 TaxID=3344665 RepID=UPI0035D51A1E
MDSNQKIRIKDIARKAGTSVGTVDRVLHNRGEVKEETRVKILSIIEELNYTPNLLAKSLASKKLFRIAVLLPAGNAGNPYWSKPIAGIKRAEDELKDYNFAVDIYTFNDANEKSFFEARDEVLKSHPDGVLFNPVFREAAMQFTILLDELEIPYVFFDVNIDFGNPLAYFGQDAWQSGFVAGKLINYGIPDNSTVLVLKLANNKVISHHILKREKGFLSYFDNYGMKNIRIISKEVDLLHPTELKDTLSSCLKKVDNLAGVFVSGSRVYKVAKLVDDLEINNTILIGYDLIDENLKYLNKGVIDFLISQKPEEQGYNGVMSLFRHLGAGNNIEKINYSTIDIIMKENLKYLKQ